MARNSRSDRLEAARRYRDEGATTDELAAEYGVQPGTISKWLSRHRDDLPPPDAPTPLRAVEPEAPVDLTSMTREERLVWRVELAQQMLEDARADHSHVAAVNAAKVLDQSLDDLESHRQGAERTDWTPAKMAEACMRLLRAPGVAELVFADAWVLDLVRDHVD